MGGVLIFFYFSLSLLIRDQQNQLIQSLTQIFGNKPTISITIDTITPLSDQKCQVVIYIEEKQQQTNEIKRIPATDVCQYLNQPMTKQQIGQLGVEKILALIPPDDDQLQDYLKEPPKGIDPRMWKQAQIDNPDAGKLIPVPIMGSAEVSDYFHQSRLLRQ